MNEAQINEVIKILKATLAILEEEKRPNVSEPVITENRKSIENVIEGICLNNQAMITISEDDRSFLHRIYSLKLRDHHLTINEIDRVYRISKSLEG